MAAHQHVLFTALPNGIRDGTLSLSVHIAPRLTNDTGNTTLAAFRDWLDWPATVSGLTWQVQFGSARPVGASVVSAAPRSDLWALLFGHSTPVPVMSHVFTPLDSVPVESYPALNVAAFIEDVWTKVAATSPKEWPLLADLLTGTGGLLAPLKLGTDEMTGLENEIDKELVNGAVTNPAPPNNNVPKDFVQLLRFHQPPASAAPKGGRIDLDFHQAVATLGQHPPLLRLLGLVIDLEVILTDVPASPTTVKVIPAGWVPDPLGPSHPAPLPAAMSVATRCEITASSFRAQAKPGPGGKLVDGRLAFDDATRYGPIQFDVDGAAIKAVDFARNLTRALAAASTASPENYALPSLRSAGLAIAEHNRAVKFHEQLGDATALNIKVQTAPTSPPDPASTPMVWAEDVTRGYHIDVWDEAEQRWFPLCARTGEYRFGDTPVAIPDGDEGFVSTVATSAPAVNLDDPPDELKLPEPIVRWAGWSLVAPRPGGRLSNPDGSAPDIDYEPGATDPAFPLDIHMRATEASLPRLRFGRKYRLRARAVDLAGHSVPIDRTVQDPHASAEITYGRFEPVAAPPVLPHAPRTEGESLERVVLRSHLWHMPLPVNATVSRHIVPPKASQLLAEQHGMFDTAGPGSVVDPSTYGVIAPYPGLDPDPDQSKTPAEQGTFAMSDEGKPDPDDYKGTRYFPQDLVSLPYLPDPLARGAALRFLDLPGQDPDTPVPAEFTPLDADGWPRRRALRLVMGERHESVQAVPEVLADGRVKVLLAKGEVVHVRVSSYLPLHDAQLEQLGLWQWITKAKDANPADPAIIVTPKDVQDGQVWPITPYRTLTLVHAVRQPLKPAQFHKLAGAQQFKPTKGLGDTFATFGGTITYSRRSTSQIDLFGKWQEWIDLGPQEAEPTNPPSQLPEPRGALAFTIPGDRDPGTAGIDSVLVRGDRHEFSDTKHRIVTYGTVATTRFAEYFAQRLVTTVDPSATVPLDTGGKGVVPGSVDVKNKVTQVDDDEVQGAGTYVEGRSDDPGDLVVEGADYSVDELAGTVLFAADFPGSVEVVITYRVPPFTRPMPGELLEPATVNIVSSARPATPKVAYVIPTFAWDANEPAPGTTHSTRRGNGLRVYLERPWWSSGQGELLGVVLSQSEPVAAESALSASVTRVGVDPVFASGPTAAVLSAANFEGATAQAQDLTLPGVDGTVDVVGHEVGFDVDRDLWYADLQFKNVGSYFPFVRLALARFQPDSVRDAHLSAVTVADFVQLAPNRFATVAPGDRGTRRVTVSGPGYSKAADIPAHQPLVQATVEQQVQSSDLGWKPVGAPVTLQPGLSLSPGQRIWAGNVTVPSNPAGPPMRLVIEEFERHATTGLLNHLNVPVAGPRLVYSDIIAL